MSVLTPRPRAVLYLLARYWRTWKPSKLKPASPSTFSSVGAMRVFCSLRGCPEPHHPRQPSIKQHAGGPARQDERVGQAEEASDASDGGGASRDALPPGAPRPAWDDDPVPAPRAGAPCPSVAPGACRLASP